MSPFRVSRETLSLVLGIPEVTSLLASHLDHATLAACVRVSKEWHRRFIPKLWHTFGTFPWQPVRFGPQYPPRLKLPNIDFPLYVPSDKRDQDTSGNLTPIFTDLKSEILESNTIQRRHLRLKRDMWYRLFAGVLLQPDDKEAIVPIVTKHAKYIRYLTTRSLSAFEIYEPICQQLTGLRLMGNYHSYGSLVADEARIISFVEKQVNLRSICVEQYLESCHSLLTRIDRNWFHFNVQMYLQEDYHNLVSLLPNTRVARFDVDDDSSWNMSADFRLPQPHMHLQELEVYTSHFDHRALQDILCSFPNLRRLIVDGTEDHEFLELVIDKGGWSILYIEEGFEQGLDRMLPLLPKLVGFTDGELEEPHFEQLAQHCPHLVFYTDMSENASERHPVYLEVNDRNQQWLESKVPTPMQSVSQLLSSCPNLQHIECQRWPMRFKDVVTAPWVCTKLKKLMCVFTMVPLLSESEKQMYYALLDRRQTQSTADQRMHPSDLYGLDETEEEREVLGKACSLATYLIAVEEQFQRLPVLDIDGPCDTPEIPLVRHFESVKASIWP